MRAQQAKVYLQPADAAKGTAAVTRSRLRRRRRLLRCGAEWIYGWRVWSGWWLRVGSRSSSRGGGRRGEQLVYTAADGMFVLTGTAGGAAEDDG